MANQEANDNRPPQPEQPAGSRQADRQGDKAARSTARKPGGQNQQRRDSKH